MEPLTGDDPEQIAGYRLRARLGSGGMGRVYLAFTPAGRPVALKVIRPDSGGDDMFRRRFRHEIAAARRVHGLYTAQVIDADPDASPPWLVTAYVPGPSLQEAVAAHGPMPEQTVYVLLAGVAEALAAIHAAGIVHRDLKPSNVLLAPDGPRVIDFGVARAEDATELTRTGVRIGSAPFMAPEQVDGAEPMPAFDLFALGAVGAFAAQGRPAFSGGSEMAVLYRVLHAEPDLSGCPLRLREVLDACLAKDPVARPTPADVIAMCRERTAGGTGELSQPWLPPAVTATLARHAATPAPLPGPSLPVPSPAAPAPPPQETPGPAETPTHTVPARQAPAPGGLAAPATDPGRPGFLTRPVALGGGLAAIGVAALAVAGLLAFSSRGGASPSPRRSQAAATGTRRPAALDACLVGTWRDVAFNQFNTINNTQVEFTGKGDLLIIKPDGSARELWDNATLTATVNGNRWKDVFSGSAAFHLDTRGGYLLYSAIVPAAGSTWTLYENGTYNNSGPSAIEPGPERYSCSGSTLRTYADNGSQVYVRQR